MGEEVNGFRGLGMAQFSLENGIIQIDQTKCKDFLVKSPTKSVKVTHNFYFWP